MSEKLKCSNCGATPDDCSYYCEMCADYIEKFYKEKEGDKFDLHSTITNQVAGT